MDTFNAPDRPPTLLLGDERAQLESWLNFYRATLLTKCRGLDEAQLKIRPVASSQLSLLGLIRHMTAVEQYWFATTFAGADVLEYYANGDDPDSDFHDLDELDLDTVLANYRDAITTSDNSVAGHDLVERAAQPSRDREVGLRWIYLHMIEEYARHCGHADIVRELIDGVTGY